MATVTTRRAGRRWLLLPAYAVDIVDPTGRITFHGYGRHEADALAAAVGPIIGQRPVGPLAREIALCEPATGVEWTARL